MMMSDVLSNSKRWVSEWLLFYANSKIMYNTLILESHVVQPDWSYFEWTEQIISINPYKLIQTWFAMLLKTIFIFSK
jgi:hypothetical protein